VRKIWPWGILHKSLPSPVIDVSYPSDGLKDTRYRLSDLHTAWICWCAADTCPHYQIIWVSEDETQSIPNIPQAEQKLYEIKWGKAFGRWFCWECFLKMLPGATKNFSTIAYADGEY
jgi:hypothetical protein